MECLFNNILCVRNSVKLKVKVAFPETRGRVAFFKGIGAKRGRERERAIVHFK